MEEDEDKKKWSFNQDLPKGKARKNPPVPEPQGSAQSDPPPVEPERKEWQPAQPPRPSGSTPSKREDPAPSGPAEIPSVLPIIEDKREPVPVPVGKPAQNSLRRLPLLGFLVIVATVLITSAIIIHQPQDDLNPTANSQRDREPIRTIPPVGYTTSGTQAPPVDAALQPRVNTMAIPDAQPKATPPEVSNPPLLAAAETAVTPFAQTVQYTSPQPSLDPATEFAKSQMITFRQPAVTGVSLAPAQPQQTSSIHLSLGQVEVGYGFHSTNSAPPPCQPQIVVYTPPSKPVAPSPVPPPPQPVVHNPTAPTYQPYVPIAHNPPSNPVVPSSTPPMYQPYVPIAHNLPSNPVVPSSTPPMYQPYVPIAHNPPSNPVVPSSTPPMYQPYVPIAHNPPSNPVMPSSTPPTYQPYQPAAYAPPSSPSVSSPTHTQIVNAPRVTSGSAPRPMTSAPTGRRK